MQACCRDQFKYSFSFCLFTTQFSGGRQDLPVVPEDMCVIHAGGFLKHLQWSQVIQGTKIHCWMLCFTQKQPSTGGCWKSQHYPGQTTAVSCGRISGSIPPVNCCRATRTLSSWEVDFSRQTEWAAGCLAKHGEDTCIGGAFGVSRDRAVLILD